MNELALFAGAGGGLLGTALLGWTPVCAVEKAPYRREVLLRRQRDGVLPMFPIWDDVRTFDGRSWRGLVDVVTAGFPCQPWTVQGKRQGELDDRNLWPDTIRIIREVAPEWVLLENVPGLLSNRYFGNICADMASFISDNGGGWFTGDVFSAAAIAAPHLRKRWFAVANAYCAGQSDVSRGTARTQFKRGRFFECDGCCRSIWKDDPAQSSPQSRLVRMADGIPDAMDRIASLGDAQVPAVVATAWMCLNKDN